MGVWTRTLKDMGFKRIIALEPQVQYHHWIDTMDTGPSKVVEAVKKDGYDWETYNILKEPEYLGLLEKKDWSEGKRKKHI